MPRKAKQKKTHHKTIALLVLALMVISVCVIYFGILHKDNNSIAIHEESKIDGVYLTKPTTINDFNLTDNAGQAFTKASLKDHWTLMFFGFTNCGMICPTTMAALNQMYQTLSKDLPPDKMPQVVMVSVDPDRDTVERMNEYVTAFNPHFIGVRAEMPEVDKLKAQLHIVSAKMQVGENKNQYTINHSAEIMVFNPQGQLQAYLSFPHKAEQLVKDYKFMLSNR